MPGVLSEKTRSPPLRQSRRPPQRHPFREKLSIAGGAVGYAPPPKLLLTPESHHAGMGAGGQQHTEAAQRPTAGADGFHIALQLQAGDLCQQEFRAEALRLSAHGLGQFSTAGVLHAGVIDHLRGNGDLSAKVILFHNYHPITGTGQVECGGKACRPPPMTTTS